MLCEFNFMQILNRSDRLLFWEIVDSDGIYEKLKFPLEETLDFICIWLFATYWFFYLFLECLWPSE